MKTAIKIIKRQQKLKEPIKLRVKNLKTGTKVYTLTFTGRVNALTNFCIYIWFRKSTSKP